MQSNEAKAYVVAAMLVTRLFKDKVDKAGVPYIKHLKFVSETVPQDDATLVIIGLLHDILEDTPTTAQELKTMGFNERIVSAVVALTKRKGEAYYDYLDRVKANSDAIQVKLADLVHNMDITRIPEPTEYDYKRLRKYQQASKALTKALIGKC